MGNVPGRSHSTHRTESIPSLLHFPYAVVLAEHILINMRRVHQARHNRINSDSIARILKRKSHRELIHGRFGQICGTRECQPPPYLREMFRLEDVTDFPPRAADLVGLGKAAFSEGSRLSFELTVPNFAHLFDPILWVAGWRRQLKHVGC
jgi:hypothetical protein